MGILTESILDSLLWLFCISSLRLLATASNNDLGIHCYNWANVFLFIKIQIQIEFV